MKSVPSDQRGPARRRPAAKAAAALAGLGVTALIIGAAIDICGFDRTRGGYEPPFDDWTGTPIDWSEVTTTPTGMLREGFVIDFLADCTTGMIHGRIAGITIPFRPFSERAIAVHKPREACIARGFSPRF